jgi:hypothetical protein
MVTKSLAADWKVLHHLQRFNVPALEDLASHSRAYKQRSYATTSVPVRMIQRRNEDLFGVDDR